MQTILWGAPAAKTYPLYLSHAKTDARWGAEVIRAMGANLLVCLAAWQAQAAQDIIGKIFGIFFPVLAFVSMSFSHVVANMFWVRSILCPFLRLDCVGVRVGACACMFVCVCMCVCGRGTVCVSQL